MTVGEKMWWPVVVQNFDLYPRKRRSPVTPLGSKRTLDASRVAGKLRH